MKQVWKFTFRANAVVRVDIEVPENCVFLSAGLEPNDDGAIWALVDPKATKVKRTLLVVGTGFGEVPEGFNYIGRVDVPHPDSIGVHYFRFHIFISVT